MKMCPHEPNGPLPFRHEPVAHQPGSKFCWTCGGKLVSETEMAGGRARPA